MSRGHIRPWNYSIMSDLVEVAQGQKPADLYFAGGNLIDVYSGTLRKANIAIRQQRIAYLGLSEKMVGPETQIIQVEHKYLSPGYIDPHGHPFQLYNPSSYAQYVLRYGTTCSINDTLLFLGTMKIDNLLDMVEALAGLPIKMLWSARLDPQTLSHEENPRFSYSNIRRLIDHPLFLQVGEVTDWPALLAGNCNMQRWMVDTLNAGKKAEGHAPAASPDTLNALAAAGITACHESITAEEVIHRIELGLYATLRYSSLRPDLPLILQGLLQKKHVSWERMMMTIDGPAPSHLIHGATDHLIRIAIQAGVAPVTAYQMVTRNPAVYYGLDSEIGGLAPGRLADILVLSDLTEPTPEQVYADGRLIVNGTVPNTETFLSTPSLKWPELGLGPLKLGQRNLERLQMLPLYSNEPVYPIMELINPVITRKKDVPIDTEGLNHDGKYLQIEPKSGLCYAVVITRDYTRIAHGIIRGFVQNLDALASSYNISQDLVILGQDPAAMLQALQRVEELGGGIAMVHDDQVIWELPLTLGGNMSDQAMPKLIQVTQEMEKVLQQAGHPHYDPLHTLLFISTTHLPEIRLTRNGLVTVKDRCVLRPSLPL